MQLIQEEAIRTVVSIGDARRAVHDAFCALSDGVVLAPDEMAMKLTHGGELHVKGAYLGGSFLAFKVATGGFPEGSNNGFTSVIDAATGAPAAILQDGGWLTEMRTAAASAVSAVALARSDSRRLAILGAGFQAAFQVAALRDVFDLASVSVWSRTEESSARFAAANDAVAAKSVADAVDGADIVICCTPSREPLLHAAMLRDGAHVIAMGADMAGKRELAADVLDAATVITVDDRALTLRVGEMQHGSQHAGRAVALGDVLTDRAPGRRHAGDLTLTDLCGLGVQDAAMAQLVMSRLAS